MGSPEIEAVRSYIINQLAAPDVDQQRLMVPDYYGSNRQVPVVNIIGRFPGRASQGAVLLMAHYDTFPATGGANDNTAAVAALLETARALSVGEPLRNDVILLFTDAEEPSPRYGAKAFVADHPLFSSVRLVVNLEAVGGTGASVAVETSGSQEWLVGNLDAAVDRPTMFSFLTETTSLLGDIGTDFDEFRNAGVPGYHFAYVHDSSIYHTTRDDTVGMGSLQHHGDLALGIARHFGDIDLSPGEPSDLVFFWLGFALVRYSTGMALILALAALFGLGLLLVRDRPDRSGRRIAMTSGVAGAAIVAGTLLWMALAGLRPEMGLIESYVYYCLLLIATAWAVSSFAPSGEGTTSLVVLAVLAAVTAFAAPGLSYLFTWPALAVLTVRLAPPLHKHFRFGLVALVSLPLLVPAIDIFIQMAQPRPGNPDSSMPVAVVVPLALGLLTVRTLTANWPQPLPREVAMAHEELVDSPGTLAPLLDGPDHQ